jgi:dTDP-4-amino-4,6-dideoxygalactose transaminase
VRQIGIGTFEATPEMFRLVNQVLRSGRISYGPLSQQFEARFAEMHGCKYGVLSNSGTSSLLVALQTLKELHGWQDGDEVIVPALTFVATVNVVLQLRLKPVLVDVEPDFYGIDTEQLIRTISYKTRCIIPVHTFGQPCDMPEVQNTVNWLNPEVYPIKVMEDSCEAMAVKHCNTSVGCLSDIGVFSTYIAHILVTGVGGIATTNNPNYAKIMRSLVNHGIDLAELPTGEQYDPTWLARKFRFTRIGHSFRLTELEAALGLAQLDDLPAIIRKRQQNAAYLTEGLKPFEDRLQLPAIRPNTEHAFQMYPLVCRQEGVRDALCRHLESNGIETRLMLPLVSQPVYKGLWEPEDYPVARWIDDNGFYIGCHQNLTREDLDYTTSVFGDFFSSIL